MRISLNMIYSTAISDMNTALSRMAVSQEQSSTQKRINRPSDDPAGYAEARSIDSVLSGLNQFSSNIDVARSWLEQADSTLVEASTVMTSIKELATQAATGTLSADNREEVAIQVRSLFSELLSLSNTSVTGKSIFAGQKTNGQAFDQTLNATINDDSLGQDAVVKVTGASDTSVLVKFTDAGTVGGAADIGYTYSADGGQTWTSKTLAAGSATLDLGSCAVSLRGGINVSDTDTGTGTSLVVRPSAVYLGDDQDGASVRNYGAAQISAAANGVFSGNVTVRIASNASLPGPISYSYSTNGGLTWISGNVASNAKLPVPGGFLELASNGGSSLAAGAQFTIVPNTAYVNLSISPTGTIAINNVGKDVFGGLYTVAGASNASVVFGSNAGQNIFETVGELIGCLETNDIDGVGKALDKLTVAQTHLESCAASVGARENRLDFAENTLSVLKDNATTRLSDVEDADLAEVLLELTKNQYTYQSVLASSTKIMGLSLLDYMG